MHTNDTAGARIPTLGFGTWEPRDGLATQMVRSAIEIGHRHVGTAIRHGNEAAVGAGIHESGGDLDATVRAFEADGVSSLADPAPGLAARDAAVARRAVA